MLATLYARALDADLPSPILGDIHAKELVAQLDYDWAKTGMNPRNSPSATIRTAHFDRWVRQFLAVHDEATVLHLGCGLDARALRVHPGPGVEWYDVDFGDVIALRERFYPSTASYRLIPASLTELDWLTTVTTYRPVLMIAEGLTMYLTEASGLALLRRIVELFPCGELQFDVFNRFGIRTQITNAVARRAGARLHWGVDGVSGGGAGHVVGARAEEFGAVSPVCLLTRCAPGRCRTGTQRRPIPGPGCRETAMPMCASWVPGSPGCGLPTTSSVPIRHCESSCWRRGLRVSGRPVVTVAGCRLWFPVTAAESLRRMGALASWRGSAH
jgi:hypothetical protein